MCEIKTIYNSNNDYKLLRLFVVSNLKLRRCVKILVAVIIHVDNDGVSERCVLLWK